MADYQHSHLTIIPYQRSMHELLAAAKAHESSIVEMRRTLHTNPELSFQEHETCAFIQQRLAELGIESGVLASTGVVAHIGTGERCVALRADIDALPIHEESGVAFASQKQGVMHACGHDAHTAMLLGAAKILKDREKSIGGVVKLIFQPGEEMNPGGASLLIKEGVLDGPRPEVIFGQHVNPDATAGTAAFVSGTMMASTDELYWAIQGKSGHAAQPHRASDPVLMAAQLITQLQTLVARTLNPLEAGVLSITKIHGGTATNVIPDAVEMAGTLRSMNLEWREWAAAAIAEHSERLCASPIFNGGQCTFRREKGYPPLVNNAPATEFARQTASHLLGTTAIEDFEPKMWGEDFAFYTHHIPGTFWMLGVRPPSMDVIPGLHNSKFILDESALPIGAAMLATMAVERLQS
jgi:hippurate hydrolase